MKSNKPQAGGLVLNVSSRAERWVPPLPAGDPSVRRGRSIRRILVIVNDEGIVRGAVSSHHANHTVMNWLRQLRWVEHACR